MCQVSCHRRPAPSPRRPPTYSSSGVYHPGKKHDLNERNDLTSHLKTRSPGSRVPLPHVFAPDSSLGKPPPYRSVLVAGGLSAPQASPPTVQVPSVSYAMHLNKHATNTINYTCGKHTSSIARRPITPAGVMIVMDCRRDRHSRMRTSTECRRVALPLTRGARYASRRTHGVVVRRRRWHEQSEWQAGKRNRAPFGV